MEGRQGQYVDRALGDGSIGIFSKAAIQENLWIVF